VEFAENVWSEDLTAFELGFDFEADVLSIPRVLGGRQVPLWACV
jgi:hypothetical protein